MHHLGVTYALQRRFLEAEKILNKVKAGLQYIFNHKADISKRGSHRIKGYRTTTNPNNIGQLDMIFTSQGLAHIYRKRGKFKEARKELDNTRKGIEELCNANSEYSIENMWYEVQTYQDEVEKEGRCQVELRDKFEDLISRHGYKLGLTYHRTLWVTGAFGIALIRMGRCRKARGYLLRASEGYNHKGGTYDKAIVLLYLAKSYQRELDAQKYGENTRFSLKYFNEVLCLLEDERVDCNQEGWVRLK